MKFETYAELAKDLNAENAVSKVQAMLEQARTDSVEHDAEMAELQKQISEVNDKYRDLQIEYIKKYTTEAVVDGNKKEEEPGEDEASDDDIAAAASEMMKGE